MVNWIHQLISKSNKFKALSDWLIRSSAPNLSNLIATVVMFLIVIYFQGFKTNLNITSTKARGINT